MLKNDYIISGITPQLVRKMDKEFGDNLRLFINRKTGEIETKVTLTKFEAVVMRNAIKKYNLTHPCVLQLKKVEKKNKTKKGKKKSV